MIFFKFLLLLNFFSFANEALTPSSAPTPTTVESSSGKPTGMLVEEAKVECKKQGKSGLELLECVKKLRESSH